MKEKEITVLIVEPGKRPVLTKLENSLEALQALYTFPWKW